MHRRNASTKPHSGENFDWCNFARWRAHEEATLPKMCADTARCVRTDKPKETEHLLKMIFCFEWTSRFFYYIDVSICWITFLFDFIWWWFCCLALLLFSHIGVWDFIFHFFFLSFNDSLSLDMGLCTCRFVQTVLFLYPFIRRAIQDEHFHVIVIVQTPALFLLRCGIDVSL